MSSEQLADGVNPLDAELAATWDVLKGYSGRDTDLGIARRFGGAAAAYSLRNVGTDGLPVVRVRREPNDTTAGIDDEERFSAHQVQSGILEDWVNGELESTLPADVATAAAAYSLRKVKADYGIPTTVVNGTENFPATIPSSGSPADIGNGFTVHKFSDGVADSESVTVSGGTITVTAIASGTGTFSGGCRIKGLSDNKQYTVSGEFRVTSQGADGDGVALVDISDNTAGTDEDSITTSSTTFTPFFIDAGYNGGSSNNFVDLQANSNGSNSGTLTAEFRNVQIIENNNSVVRIRRSSDDEEVVVGFDSDNKVSASSPVTATPSGSTTATTLGDFISGTDAFVHTWYDQAGSNNAVQETAANQPKIAESGALLADGLKFNGNSDNFTITNGVSGRSIFAVTNQNIDTTGGGLTGYGQDGISSLLGTAATDSYIFISNNNSAFNSYAISIDGASTGDSGQYASNGKTLSSAGGNLGTYGDIPSDTNSLLSIIYGSGDPANAWTRLGSGISGNIFMQGSMSEVILYTTDQSDNRFKIESNINNYYGLYNDANEFSSDETAFRFLGQRSGGTSASSDLTQFTLDVQTASVYAGAKLSSDVLSGDAIYVSFNCSFDSGSPSPKVALRNVDSVLNGSVHSNEENVTQGFNSFTLTSNNSDASGIIWSEGDDDVIFTITDIKVSRIARNGFVETWYDQSGNGEDMTQSTAGKQPSIVLNGGQVKDYNGNNSIDFVSGSTRVLDKSGTTTAKTCIVVLDEDSSGSAERAILGFSASTSFMRLDTGSDLEVKAGGVSANYRAIPIDVTSLYFWYTNGTDEDKLFANNVEEGDTLSNTPPNLPFTRIGARNSDNDPYNSRITEVIAFAEDLSSDRTVLQDDVNNNYNIF